MKFTEATTLLNIIIGPFIVIFAVIAGLFAVSPEQKATLLSAAIGIGSTMIQLQKPEKENKEKDLIAHSGDIPRYSDSVGDDHRGSGRVAEGEVSRYNESDFSDLP